ncbi:MAG: hypothetical protein HXY40_06205 [Chloroflexi bacterium]|nr:hypothetical protein [Chloroflexota bacterium]
MPSHPWARDFAVSKSEVEQLTNLLLEKEMPLSTEALARAVLEQRLKREAAALKERFKDTQLYNPAHSYQVGQKLLFATFGYAAGTVVKIRPGQNDDYGAFSVISVQFAPDEKPREFAAEFKVPHKLSGEHSNGGNPMLLSNVPTVDEILTGSRAEILAALEQALSGSGELVTLAGKWFPRDLLIEVNAGHLNLAEAVLDIAGGGPLTTEDILEQMGGLGKAPLELQKFTLNYSLRDDPRFDEVGSTGQVLWYLARLEPPEVLQLPANLRYTPIDFDRSLLTADMLTLETELDDELTPGIGVPEVGDSVTITLTYPHRRVGTLPLTPRIRQIMPTALKTSRVWMTLVDGQDGEETTGWVVRNEGYVFGLGPFYRKHLLPVGAYVTVKRSDDPGKIVVDFNAHRPRTEYVRLIVPKNDQITFENHKRSIGAEYDDLMILGIDDLKAVDTLFQAAQQQRKSISAILKSIMPGLARLTPQGATHAKTLYSVLNVFRRCPPGPLFATLAANPDFQNVGGHYWKLVEE